MSKKIIFSQRTARHVVSLLNSSYVYVNSFGTFGTSQIDNTGLNFPFGIAADPSNNIYVCDGNNNRIVKLDSSLAYVSSVDVTTALGSPFSIFYDSVNACLYAIGILDYMSLSIARITTGLVISKSNNNIHSISPGDRPLGISRGFGAADFLISGLDTLLNTTEGVSFSSAIDQAIVGETGIVFNSHIKNTDGFLYLISRTASGSKIHKVNSSYINVGDSDKISKSAMIIGEGLSNDLIVYNTAESKIVRYNNYLNFVETISSHVGSGAADDRKEIYGVLELDF
jgi:hypothetical protein